MSSSALSTATGIPRDFPPVVYIPCVPRREVPQELQVALRRTRDGRIALLVYSALDRLFAAIGDDSPWVMCDIDGLRAIYDMSPYDVVLRDIRVPQDRREAGWYAV